MSLEEVIEQAGEELIRNELEAKGIIRLSFYKSFKNGKQEVLE